MNSIKFSNCEVLIFPFKFFSSLKFVYKNNPNQSIKKYDYKKAEIIKGIISKLALKFDDKKNIRSKILLGNPVCMANHPNQIKIPIKPKIKIPNKFKALGTDGFGRSDSREALRSFFEVDRYYIVVAALNSLADLGKINKKLVSDAIKKYKIDPNKHNPVDI